MENCNEIVDCTGRREFLVRAAFVASGLVLTLFGAASAIDMAAEDLVVSIDNESPLNKVGGSIVVDSADGKIIILRTGDTTFLAFSAKCTHKGGIVEYDDAKRQFVCPKHGSTFDSSTGEAVHGPADEPLRSYKATGTSASVSINLGS